MNEALSASLGAAATALTAWLVYLARRKKDEPEGRTRDAVAASEVWAEYAERMEGRLLLAEEALEAVRDALAECRAEVWELAKK